MEKSRFYKLCLLKKKKQIFEELFLKIHNDENEKRTRVKTAINQN